MIHLHLVWKNPALASDHCFIFLGHYSDGSNLVVRSVRWWNEALHGVCRSCHVLPSGKEKCATQFPEANAMGSSFNASLGHSIAHAISTEARVGYHSGGLKGLTFYAPQINKAANPLWGRNMECPREDPHLTSVYAYNYVKGLQGDHPTVLKAIATPKHFMGQVFEGDGSNPWNNSTTVNRQDNDTRYTPQELESYYLPAFRAAMVDAGAGSVMCAYQGTEPQPQP